MSSALGIVRVHCVHILGFTWGPMKHYTAKVGKADIYTGESNQEQMMCISVYIVRWSEQKSSILIVSRRNTNVTCDFLNSCCMGKYNVWTF